MTYPSKKDWWIALILLATSLLDFGIGGLLFVGAVVQAGSLDLLLAGFVTVLVAGLLLWIYVSTYYDIDPPNLVVRSGPFRLTIPLEDITEVRHKTRYSLELAWHFGLSLDRLLIKYNKHGRPALFAVAISPRDKEGVLQELAREAPALREGSNS
jgi:Bacterial PH domain